MQLETRKRQGNSLWQKQVYAGMRTNAYGTRQAIGAERMKSSIASPTIGPDMRATYERHERNTRTENLQNRRRVQRAAVRERWTNTGIRATIAYGVILALVVCLGSVFLAGRAEVFRVEMQNSKIQSRVADTMRKCETLRKSIDDAEAGLFVGYAAVDLGLVSDNGVEKMVLTAPADAIVLPQSKQTGSR